jgi:hypothetical protein
MINLLQEDGRGVGAVGIGLTRDFFPQFTTKNIFVVKNIRIALSHLPAAAGERAIA